MVTATRSARQLHDNRPQWKAGGPLDLRFGFPHLTGEGQCYAASHDETGECSVLTTVLSRPGGRQGIASGQ